MSNTRYSIFNATMNRAVTGRSLVSLADKDRMHLEALRLIEEFEIAIQADNLLPAERLKLLAVMGCETAIEFYRKMPHKLPLNIVLSNHRIKLFEYLKEAAFASRDAQLLIIVYSILATTSMYGRWSAIIMPDIHEAMKALEVAASSKGIYATEAAFRLAYIYACETGYTLEHDIGLTQFDTIRINYILAKITLEKENRY